MSVDLNQVILPRLSYLLIDSVTYRLDSVTYPEFPLPPPTPPCLSYFLHLSHVYIEVLEPHSIDRVLILFLQWVHGHPIDSVLLDSLTETDLVDPYDYG